MLPGIPYRGVAFGRFGGSMMMNEAARIWGQSKEDLVRTIVSLGFPAELGDAIARHLGSPKAIDRMTAYLNYEKPTDPNTVVDEMLAIRAEIDAWKRKKAAFESNGTYNDLLYYGLGEEEETVEY